MPPAEVGTGGVSPTSTPRGQEQAGAPGQGEDSRDHEVAALQPDEAAAADEAEADAPSSVRSERSRLARRIVANTSNPRAGGPTDEAAGGLGTTRDWVAAVLRIYSDLVEAGDNLTDAWQEVSRIREDVELAQTHPSAEGFSSAWDVVRQAREEIEQAMMRVEAAEEGAGRWHEVLLSPGPEAAGHAPYVELVEASEGLATATEVAIQLRKMLKLAVERVGEADFGPAWQAATRASRGVERSRYLVQEAVLDARRLGILLTAPSPEVAPDNDENAAATKEVVDVEGTVDAKLHAAAVERAQRSAARALIAINDRLGEPTDDRTFEIAGAPRADHGPVSSPAWFRRIARRVRGL